MGPNVAPFMGKSRPLERHAPTLLISGYAATFEHGKVLVAVGFRC